MSHLPEPPEESGNPEQTELAQLLCGHIAAVTPPRRHDLTARLRQRAAASVAAHAGLLTVRDRLDNWHGVKPGVRYKPLWLGPAGNSVLIELDAGASLPVHRHNWLEEGIVLRGGLQMGELDLGVFDYHVSPAGSRHQQIQSRQGALAFLRGTSLGGDTPSQLRELLGGLLPLPGAAARTVYFDRLDWQAVQEGLFVHELYSDGPVSSRFCRLEPGTRVDGHLHTQDEECLMLSGEVFLGDILLQAGDYQIAHANSRHGTIYTDVGALLFVRGAAA